MASATSGPSAFAARATPAIAHDLPPGGAPEDRELISRMRRGDDTALHGLYQRYGGHVLALLARIVGDRAEAEALLQEVFLQAWRRAPEYDPQQSLPSWLFGFARARALESLRAPMHTGGRRHVQPAPASPQGDQNRGADALRDPASDQQAGRVAAVQRALAGLSDAERESLELAYYGGLSPGEIGARLGLPAEQVLLHIRQGVSRLRMVRG